MLGILYNIKDNFISKPRPPVRPSTLYVRSSVCDLVSKTNGLSDFHKTPYRLSLQNDMDKRKFRAIRLRHTHYFRMWINFYLYFPYFLTDSSKIGIGNLHLMLSHYKCSGSRYFASGYDRYFAGVFYIFVFCWIKFDKGEVYKSLFSNYEFNAKQLSENMLLQGLSQFMSVPSTFIFRFIWLSLEWL